jgi:hypothetical protein
MILGTSWNQVWAARELDDALLAWGAISGSAEGMTLRCLREQAGILGSIYRLLGEGLSDESIAVKLNSRKPKYTAA